MLMHRGIAQLPHGKPEAKGAPPKRDSQVNSFGTRFPTLTQSSQIVVIPVSDPEPMARRFYRPFSWGRDGKRARFCGVVIPTLEITTTTGPGRPAVMVTPWV